MTHSPFSFHRRRILNSVSAAAVGLVAPTFSSVGQACAASGERALNVYSVLSNRAAQPLVEAFCARYPDIAVRYDGDSGSNEIHARFLDETARGQESADVMWSSAMDLQVDLVLQGLAAPHDLRGAEQLPDWAHMGDLAWGTTVEPIGMVFNRQLLRREDVPNTRRDLTSWLHDQRARLRGKIAVFDIEKSGVGFQFAAWDYRYGREPDQLVGALGRVQPLQTSGSGALFKAVHEGRCVLGYNVITNYALTRASSDLPSLSVVYPQDYTLGMSRVMFINRNARHPRNARLWAEFMLSAQGQRILAKVLKLNAIRSDIEGPGSLQALQAEVGPALLPVAINKELAAHLDPAVRSKLAARWHAAFSASG